MIYLYTAVAWLLRPRLTVKHGQGYESCEKAMGLSVERKRHDFERPKSRDRSISNTLVGSPW
jgi:hypothetical protein